MASSRIKGITIELNGDSTGLVKSLKSVDTAIKQTQSSLKDVNNLLKLDPTNTELLTQKQKGLETAIDSTKDRLNQLKEAQSQVEKGTAEWDSLQREIIETEQNLKTLEQEYKEFGSVATQQLKAVGEKLKEVGKNIQTAGADLTKKLTVPVAALGTAVVKTAADFEAAMSKVGAVSGASAEDLEALSEKAREMGSKTKFSAEEAAEAMNYMAMAGWKTEEMLSGIEGIMNLAAASGEDLATTSDIVTDALTAFGLTAGDSAHFADILAAASSNANTNVAMMGETFQYVAPIAGAMGYSAEEVSEAIGLMANSGIKASQAGTALRKILTQLNGEIAIQGSALGEVVIQTANTDGSMRSLNEILADCRTAFAQLTESEQSTAAEALVGKTAMSGFLALMNAAPADVEKLRTAIAGCSVEMNGYSGTAEQMAAVMQDNLTGQLTILKSQLQELAISLGETLMPMIREIVAGIQGVVDWLNGLDEKTKQIIVVAALVAAAIGPVLVVIGTVISSIGTVATAIGGLIAILSGPFGLAIAAVVLAITGIITVIRLLRENWTTIMAFINTTVANIKTKLLTTFTNIRDGIKNTVTGIKDTIVSGFEKAVAYIKSLPEQALTWGRDIIQGVINGIKQKIEDLKNAAAEIAGTIKSFIGFSEPETGPLSNFHTYMPDMIDLMTKGIREGIPQIQNAVSQLASSMSANVQGGSAANAITVSNSFTFNGGYSQADADEIFRTLNRQLGTLYA